jgi:hypothetical protein
MPLLESPRAAKRSGRERARHGCITTGHDGVLVETDRWLLFVGAAPHAPVGTGNAYVAEAKRQLAGRVGIDLLAGLGKSPRSRTSRPIRSWWRPDLLRGRPSAGRRRRSRWSTTSEELKRSVRAEVDRQLPGIASRRYGWHDHGAIIVATDGETVAAVSEMLAPEQLGVQTAEDEGYHGWLRNYGWIFLGFRATVAFSDTDVTGTNQVLPTGHAARCRRRSGLPEIEGAIGGVGRGGVRWPPPWWLSGSRSRPAAMATAVAVAAAQRRAGR